MPYAKSAVFLLGLCLVVGAEGSIVDFIVPCHINDKACTMASAEKFLPHMVEGDQGLHISTLDPIVMKSVNASTEGLDLGLFDLIVKGLAKCTLNTVERPEDLKIFLDVLCPVSANGQYKMNGSMLGIPIYGHGDFELKPVDMKITATIRLKSVEGSDGKQHLKVQKFDYKYLPISNASLFFANLFDGDEELAKPMNDVMSKEGNAVLLGPGQEVIRILFTKVVQHVNQVFDIVPKDELELKN